MNEDIKKKIATLATDLGLSNLAPEKQEEITEVLGQQMMVRLIAECESRRDEEGTKKLRELIEKEDSEGMKKILSEKISNYHELSSLIAQETIDDFKVEMQK